MRSARTASHKANLPQPSLTSTRNGIGIRKEKSLHAALIGWYAESGDTFEVPVDGFIADIRRGDLIIEVQTRSFASIRRKLLAILEQHSVRLVYPIAREKWIVRMRKGGGVIGRRKSPKRGRLEDLFRELVSIPDLIRHPLFSIEVLITQEEEVRRADGRGSWRRRGQTIVDRRLLSVLDRVQFETCEEFARLVPSDMPGPFTNRDLADRLVIPVYEARRMTYCLRRMGAISIVSRRRNELLFQKVKGKYDGTSVSE